MLAGSAAVLAFLALITAITLYKKKLGKKAIPWLFLIAGIGLTGMLGGMLTSVVGLLTDAVATFTNWAAGRPITLALTLVFAIILIADMKPKGGSGGSMVTYGVALLFPAVLAATGFAFAPELAEQFLSQLARSADEFIAGLGR